jgi:hypothetical protein
MGSITSSELMEGTIRPPKVPWISGTVKGRTVGQEWMKIKIRRSIKVLYIHREIVEDKWQGETHQRQGQ